MSESFDDLLAASLAGEKVTAARLAKARASADLDELERAVAVEDERRKLENARTAALEAADAAAHSWFSERERILGAYRTSALALAEATAAELHAAYRPVNDARRGLRQAGLPDFSGTSLPSVGEISPTGEQVADAMNEARANFLRRSRVAGPL